MVSDGESVNDDETVDPDSLEQDLNDDEQLSSDEDFGDWGGGDLEAAYLKAMSALEASELELPGPTSIESSSESDEQESDSALSRNLSVESSDAAATSNIPQALSVEDQIASLQEMFPEPETAVNAAASGSAAITSVETPLTPRQIIEACLFVGGSALTSKRLSGVLRGDFDSEYVDREIDELNRRYAAESRPYEIRLGEGGYRLTLREEFERIRHKVYGLGPKEVRLSQEALEVLAVVAYHQPIKQLQVEELGKPGCGAVLRQLVRRELLAVERDPVQPREVSYKTTPRFLSLFGIQKLDDLPRHEQVSYK